MDDSAYSTGNHKDASFTEDARGPGWNEKAHSGPMSADLDAGEAPKEHSEDPDNPCRDALMDCYNQ